MANQIIDIHSHFLTSEYLKFLEKQKALLKIDFHFQNIIIKNILN